jgi:hypothetical protein
VADLRTLSHRRQLGGQLGYLKLGLDEGQTRFGVTSTQLTGLSYLSPSLNGILRIRSLMISICHDRPPWRATLASLGCRFSPQSFQLWREFRQFQFGLYVTKAGFSIERTNF